MSGNLQTDSFRMYITIDIRVYVYIYDRADADSACRATLIPTRYLQKATIEQLSYYFAVGSRASVICLTRD